MTVNDLRTMTRECLTPAIVASVIGGDPHIIRTKAKEGKLEYPYFFSGNRLKIPRLAFINFMEGKPSN